MRKRILFLQLPLLDNDPAGASENHRLAARYLRYAVERSGEDRYFESVIGDPQTDRFDDRRLIDSVLAEAPHTIAATLYAWNVERTLDVLREVRRRMPDTVVAVGGPEVDRAHPFLFRSSVVDVATVGEGEPVFPSILRTLRTGGTTDFTNVGWRSGRGWRWGTAPPPRIDLWEMLPPAGHAVNRPDGNGMAYLEITRGCPARCAFCCYRRQRTNPSRLTVEDAVARIRVLRRRGAREIRCIDPTFNSHPRCAELLDAMARLNRDGRLAFFAEIRADTLTPDMADRLARANVKQLEIGVQSSDPAVLRAAGRSSDVERVFRGIDLLAGRGAALTLDVMCGLPEQTLADVRTTVDRLARIRGGYVQLLHTLLVPGSGLRRQARRHGLRAQARPPYRVLSTPRMTARDMVSADEYAADRLGRRPDSPARRFVGARLADLFPERVYADIGSPGRPVGGRENRRAIVFRGDNLFRERHAVYAVVRASIDREPRMLWQFVLNPLREEPLDLMDGLIGVIDEFADHFLDRIHARRNGTHRVARRVFVLLRRGGRYDPAWVAAAEALLGEAFY